MIGPEERLAHIKECLPEICSLDCGTLNFSDTDMIYISTLLHYEKWLKWLVIGV